jgi:hypothetical protein
MQDGLGDFQGVLERAANDSAYAEGIREARLAAGLLLLQLLLLLCVCPCWCLRPAAK